MYRELAPALSLCLSTAKSKSFMERSIQSSVVTLLYISGAAHIARTKPNIPAMDKSSPKND